MASLLPNGKQIFVDANGTPLAGGFVFFYVPGTTTLKTTWADPNQTTANTNPVVLDGAGGAVIYGSGQYRQVLQDLNGNQIWDDLTADPLTNVGPITFNGPATFGSSVAVTGALTVAGSTTLGATEIQSTLYVASALNVGTGGATITGGLTSENGVTIATGGLTISADGLNCTGFAVFNSGANITGGLTIGTGGATITGGLTSENGVTIATGGLTISADGLNCTGFAVFNSGANITGGLTIGTGGATITGGLTASGGTSLSGDTVQTGSLFVHSGAVLSDGIGIAIGSYYYLSGTGPGGPTGGGTFTYGFTTNNRMSAAEFDAFSDSRANNKQPISREAGLRFARIVTPITFEWNGLAAAAPTNPGEVQAGYSAQQIIAAGFGHMTSASPNAKMPETVETFDGVEVRSVAGVEMHVNYSEATPYLHVALSAALDMIAALEARLAAAGL